MKLLKKKELNLSFQQVEKNANKNKLQVCLMHEKYRNALMRAVENQ